MTTHVTRRAALLMTATAAVIATSAGTAHADQDVKPENVLFAWYKLVLELVRHTPTYSPPVASRSFAYVGIAAYEALATGSTALKTLAGQLNDLKPLAPREIGQAYNEAVVVNAVMARAVADFFGNTGPTGLNVIERFGAKRLD